MSEACYFYGVNGSGGGYVVPPWEPDPASPVAPQPGSGRPTRSFDPDDPHIARPARRPRRRRGLIYGADANDLASSGWAIVFAHDAGAAVVEALQPLIELRRAQASKVKEARFRLCTGAAGHRPNETADDFLERHKVLPGLADPDRFPYHVLLVGDPERVPFAFQFELDTQYSVGRVCFDTPDEYAAYARAVVEAEARTRVRSPVPLAFFATEHTGDRATEASARHLVEELARGLGTSGLPCEVSAHRGRQATKETALRLLGGDLKPALLFTATHGVAFERGDPRHPRHQGALLCQDSPGPALHGSRPLPPDHYVWAEDVSDQADVSGLVAFFFGCYTAGTPSSADASCCVTSEPLRAHTPFLSRLPQRLLAHPRGGALAVIGHVDPAWSGTFWTPRAGANVGTFQTLLSRIVNGERLGWALEAFGQAGGQVSTALEGARARRGPESRIDTLRTMNMRNYMLLGDPAVRLPPAPPKRPRRVRGFDPEAPFEFA